MEPVLPWINMHQKHEVASDDDLHQESYSQKSRSKRKYRHQQLEDTSVKKRRVNFRPKTEPELPWINKHHKHEVASDDDLHQESYLQKSYETLLQSNAHDAPSRLWQGDYLRSSPTRLWELNKRSLDVSSSTVVADHKSRNQNVKRKILKKGTVKQTCKRDVVPMDKVSEAELDEAIQMKDSLFTRLKVEHCSQSWKADEKPEKLNEVELNLLQKSSSFANQNPRTALNNIETKPLSVPPCDLRPHERFCETRFKMEHCSQSWKADEKPERLNELDLDAFIDSLRFKKRQSQILCTLNDDSERSDSSVVRSSRQSSKCRKTNIQSKWQKSKDDYFVSKSILPIADEDDFEFCRVLPKRKILLFDKSSVISSGDELDVDLPDLDNFENQSTDEPLLNSTFAENVSELKKFAKSPQSIKRIFSTPVPTSVPIIMETATAFTETSCSGASDKCHLYVEFPPFLSEPSSNSWLKRCHGDCEATVSSNWPKVSQFSMSKVAFVKVLFEADAPPGVSHRRSKLGHVCEEQPSEVYSEDASCHMVSFIFRNLTTFKSQPTVSLTATLLNYLSYSRLPTDSRSLHRALKGAACLHLHRNDLPFSSKMLFQVLEIVSEVNGDQQRFNNTLILDLMVSCLEMEFIVNFQESSLRGMRKSKLFELFDSTSARRSIQTQLCITCQRYNPKDRDLVRTLPLLQRLLGVADGVIIAAVYVVAQIASMLIGEYEAGRQLSVRVALLESVSFPFHRFVMVRQVLERWRAGSMTHSLRSLMVADVGSLLDAYFTDRFLSTLVMEGLSTEMAEELVMLLYTLVESYLHTQKGLLHVVLCLNIIVAFLLLPYSTLFQTVLKGTCLAQLNSHAY